MDEDELMELVLGLQPEYDIYYDIEALLRERGVDLSHLMDKPA